MFPGGNGLVDGKPVRRAESTLQTRPSQLEKIDFCPN